MRISSFILSWQPAGLAESTYLILTTCRPVASLFWENAIIEQVIILFPILLSIYS